MGNALLSLLVIVISIYLLAIITDEYFVSSLDAIADRLKLPANVAGASLMAMGSSAPELAIALLALFTNSGEHGDLGIGTIVGSAVFNILIITGVSAIARPAHITWRVVVRDIVMYVACIAALLTTISDGSVSIVEALLFLGLYALYLFILYNWESFAAGEETNVANLMEDAIDEERVQTGLYFRVTDRVSRAIGVLMGDVERNYVRVFLVSILLIAVLSWFLVEYAVILANALRIDPVIIALTILAGGTSVPDMFASLVVARQGRGEMAIANAVGSNVFDILIGLGFPWLLAILIRGETVTVGTDDLVTSTLILLGTVLLLFIFLTTDRVLSRREGWVLVAVYVVFVGWAWLGGIG
jgi:K+-dependent Na+/Ca+ exchanger-like protein